MRKKTSTVNAAPVAYFYCARNAAEPERSNSEEILRSILEQVCSDTTALPITEPVITAYEVKKKETREDTPKDRLTMEETTKLLLQICEENPTTIVIDALDECDPERKAQPSFSVGRNYHWFGKPCPLFCFQSR